MSDTNIQLVQWAGVSPKTTLSPPCAKVHMALRFKGLEYKIYNCKSSKDVKRFNARGRVPSLVIDGEVFVDSSDILSEIDRRWPTPPLLPEGTRDQALCRMIEDWVDEVLYFYGLAKRWCFDDGFAWLKPTVFGSLPAPLSWFVPNLIRKQVGGRAKGQGVGVKPREAVDRELNEGLQMMSDLLGNQDFFFGSEPTRADISFSATLDQTQIPGLPPALAIDLSLWPNLKAWSKRMHLRIPTAAWD